MHFKVQVQDQESILLIYLEMENLSSTFWKKLNTNLNVQVCLNFGTDLAKIWSNNRRKKTCILWNQLIFKFDFARAV